MPDPQDASRGQTGSPNVLPSGVGDSKPRLIVNTGNRLRRSLKRVDQRYHRELGSVYRRAAVTPAT
jgi:hypothetical protein